MPLEARVEKKLSYVLTVTCQARCLCDFSRRNAHYAVKALLVLSFSISELNRLTSEKPWIKTNRALAGLPVCNAR